MDKLDALRVYCQIIDSGGLNKAAQMLGVSPAFVSQSLTKLEKLYNSRLLERSTRRISITDAGRELYRQALRLLEDYDAIGTRISGSGKYPKGQLRITMPLGLAIMFFYQRLHEFAEIYPDISLDLQINDRFVDLVEMNFDIGLRVGLLPDSDAIAIPISYYRRIICASPHYISRYGKPEHPDQLRTHRCLVYRHDQSPVEWPFWINKAIKFISVSASHAANETHALLAMARAGMGITGQPEWLVAGDLSSGNLVAILDEYAIPQSQRSPGIYAVLPSGRYRTAKVDAFIHFAKICIMGEHPPRA